MGLLFVFSVQILVFDVVDVIPEPGKPLTKHKLKVSGVDVDVCTGSELI